MHCKRQLQNIRKDNLSLLEYLSKIKTTCDLLEVAGHKVYDTEQVLTVLSGFSEGYEAVVVVISSKEIPPSMQYVHLTLLAHERRIKRNHWIMIY